MANQPKKYTKFVATAATATLVASAIVPVASAAGFSDVSEKNSHAVNINALAEAGIIGGYPDGTFKPNQELTRGQVVKMLGKWVENQGFEIPADYATKARFTDLAADAKDQELVKYAALVADTGVFNGSNGALNAGGKITRENMALVLDRAFKAINDTTLVEVASEIEDVTVADLNTAKAEAREAIQALRNLGISGVENFMPKDSVTRAQFASFLNKTIKTEFELTVKEVVAVDANTLEVTLSDDKKHTVKLETALEANKETEVTFTIDGKEYTAKATFVLAVKTAEVVDALNLNVTLTDGTKHAVRLTKALEPNKATEVTFTIDKIEHKATVTYVVEDLLLEEVKAINETELQFVFNQEVLEAGAETKGNYTFTAKAPSKQKAIAPKSIELQEDGKTVIARFAAGTLVDDTTYEVVAQNIVAAKFNKLVEFEGTVTVKADTTAATLKSVEYAGGNNITATFSEPVAIQDAVVRVDGVNVTVSEVAATTVAGDYTYTINVGEDLSKLGSHNVTIVGLKDLAGNESTTLNGTYTVSNDTVAPTVESVKAVSATSFEVKFSEAVKSLGTIKVTKGNTEFEVKEAKLVNGTVSTYLVTVKPENGTNKLYADKEKTVALNVEFKGYTDNAELLGEATTKSVTLSLDTDAPSLLTTSVNKVAVSGSDLVFSVEMTEAIEDVTASKVKVISPSGVELSTSVARVAGIKGANSALDITVATEDLEQGTYTLVFEADAVKDAQGLGNAKFQTTVTSKAVDTFVALPVDNIALEAGNVIKVTFPEEMTDSALDLANYKLDNAALPAGTKAVFTNTGKTALELRLPSTFTVVADADYKFEVVKTLTSKDGDYVVASLTDASGNTISKIANASNTVKNITLQDNVAPTLVSAEFELADKTATTTEQIKLTFSENVAIADDSMASAINDLVVTVAGNEIQVNDLDVNGKEVIVSLQTALNIAQATTIDILPEGEDNAAIAITDTSVAANKVVAKKVTVTK
ncbi:S-layer homology domain-containing protein [Solibacillus isronensis]|uniref:S-layer homology domain-containing protein n=1 Tax=Solibacillus isronensis TaxID=412383 RepID=UPI0009A6C659|nr:S-layer homology domain-containing protein [Solibacillus isronensis]